MKISKWTNAKLIQSVIQLTEEPHWACLYIFFRGKLSCHPNHKAVATCFEFRLSFSHQPCC